MVDIIIIGGLLLLTVSLFQLWRWERDQDERDRWPENQQWNEDQDDWL